MNEVRHHECKHRPGWFDMFLKESKVGGFLKIKKHSHRHRGLGDTVALIAKWLGFEQKEGCGCVKRQKFLNAIIPYRWFWFAWDWIRFFYLK